MRLLVTFLLLTIPALSDWMVHLGSGEDLLTHGSTEGAIRELRLALAERPHNPAVLDALGRAEFQAGRYRSARRYFDQAVRLATKDRAASLSNSAMASIALGEHRRAEVLLREALELEPNRLTPLRLLGQTLLLQRRYGEAKTVLQTTLAIGNDPVTRGDLATLYQTQHNYGRALELLLPAVAEIGPGQARARLLTNLGWLQWKMGMREASAKSLQGALREAETALGPHHPDSAHILERYSEVLRRSGLKGESRKAAERAAAIRTASNAETNHHGFTVDWHDRHLPALRK